MMFLKNELQSRSLYKKYSYYVEDGYSQVVTSLA